MIGGIIMPDAVMLDFLKVHFKDDDDQLIKLREKTNKSYLSYELS